MGETTPKTWTMDEIVELGQKAQDAANKAAIAKKEIDASTRRHQRKVVEAEVARKAYAEAKATFESQGGGKPQGNVPAKK